MLPGHPVTVHLPLALSFLLPLLVLVFTLLIKKKYFPENSWLIIVGLQVLLTASGYIALETGETDEEITKAVLQREYVNAHEEMAEIFVGSTVLALVLGVVIFFLEPRFQFPLRLAVLLLSLISSYLGYQTGSKGGELVYVYGAAEAHYPDSNMGVDSSSENGIEPPMVEVNESLQVDETDYGNGDEVPEETSEE